MIYYLKFIRFMNFIRNLKFLDEFIGKFLKQMKNWRLKMVDKATCTCTSDILIA